MISQLDTATRYLLTSLSPHVVVFLCAEPIQGIFNIFLCLILVPLIVHALLVAHNHLADERNNLLISAIKNKHEAVYLTKYFSSLLFR
ncbi:MAG: hypothetical protein ACJAY7_000575 [Pseudohongiellaceae bacterium]|jgi:hypothetical protein